MGSSSLTSYTCKRTEEQAAQLEAQTAAKGWAAARRLLAQLSATLLTGGQG